MGSEDDDRIPLARPAMGDPEHAAAARVLESGRLVLGPENLRFEATLAAAAGRRHAVCVSSGTTALELSLWALGLADASPRQASAEPPEVLVPAGGFPAAAHAALRAGARPVLVDIAPGTWTMDLDAARAALTPRTRALVSIDTLGLVAEAEPLEALCRDAGVALIADAACSLGGRDSQGRPGGGYGALAIYSFHPRKVITTGEGGAILCDDDGLAGAVRTLRHLGQSAPGQFALPGTNARLPEIAAAIGSAQMTRLGAMLRERRLLVEGYRERLGRLRAAGKLTWQEAPPGAAPAHQTFAVLLAEHLRLPSRDQVRAYLADAGIESQIAIYALHGLDSVRPALPAGATFPVAEAVARCGLALPLYVGMRSAQLDRVCDTLAEVLA
jgi:dTDP-4-amino-4,6-dideoxygalactose transaminase